MIKAVQLTRTKALYQQVAEHLAAAIMSGEMAPGTRLPTTQGLAKTFQVAVTTMQEALARVQQRGLITRMPGRGTVVSATACARTWGVIFGEPVLGSIDRRIYAVIAEHLVRLLRQRGCDLRIYHPDSDGSLDNAWHDIERDATAGLLRVLMPLAPSAAIDQHLANPPLPISCGSPWICDVHALGRLGAAHLLAHGRRRLAVVAADPAHRDELLAGCAAAGATDSVSAGHANTENAAFLLADERLHRPGPAPDAWLVADDNACRGVLMALLWNRVEIPRQAALISHANGGMPVPAPLPITRLEFDPQAMAAATLAAADALLAGHEATPVRIPPILIPGTSCGETA